ncbi:tail fiber domain-containing protein [Xanthomarina spongicola]|uniref:Trimeric autotransporter adhesin n=1 Tax=Xanthomarina spongicola TaxID=570520 RepID=A0A316DP11_9FLAO|nr:tail fiber domain-containing protein [Xanthomarina spongicola]PWK19675.1 trimeric autotransporter adhesin [Xanthomarina spongicola]
MKTQLIIAIALLASLTAVAQQGINYKALIKDNLGNVVANQSIDVQFAILEGATTVYQEDHTVDTDSNGLIILNIGEGTTSDVFSAIDWGADNHFLNVQIDTGSGLVDLGTSQFKAVPYALNAANVSGLEALDEGNGIGWRFIGRNEANYGNIGLNAADFSYSDFVSNIYGATGNYSTSMGYLTTASGERSTAVGSVTTASAANSAAMGYGTLADDFNSLVVGTFNENSTSSTTLFQVGNGTDINDRSNAFVVEREGMITAPSLDVEEITDPKSLVTKEYFDANGSASTGLEAIDEGNGIGWRFIDRDPANYGNIGQNAVDLSISSNSSSNFGATGNYAIAFGAVVTASGIGSIAGGTGSIASGLSSIALGINSQATGDNAIALGDSAEASGADAIALGNSNAVGNGSLSFGFLSSANGRFSTAIGSGLIVNAFNSMSIGQLNIGGGNPESWIPTDPLFEIGNSTDPSNRSNALTVLKNGTITAPSFDITEIADPKALITKEYLEANVLSASGLRAIDEGNGIGWRLIGRIPNNYNNIGKDAVDFSTGTSIAPSGASGDNSFSMGSLNYSSGNYSFSFGFQCSATNDYSLAFGLYANATGTNSISIGYNNRANGSYSVALGYNTEANQTYAVAMGESTVSSGISSVAMGAETTASGNGSFAMGDSNIASGNTSVALGIITQASGDYSLAMGNNVQVSSFAASALGYNLINDDSYATVVGQNNDNTTTSSALFQVGNGVSTANRTNAFTVFRNGTATLAGTLTQSSDRRLKQDIIELDYGLNEVLQLKPVSYHWKKHPDQPKSLGLIAQEVQPIIKEIVHIAEDKDNTLSISYTELIPVLIKAMQEQQAIIDNQKQTIQSQVQASSEQTALLQTLLDRVEALEKQAISSDIELVKN